MKINPKFITMMLLICVTAITVADIHGYTTSSRFCIGVFLGYLLADFPIFIRKNKENENGN